MYFEQRRVAQAVDERRDGGLAGPFIPLVYIPQILDRFQLLGEYCRFNPHLPRKMVELAILVTARSIQAPFEFFVHTPPALRYGISQADVEAIAASQKPVNLDEDEWIIYDFCKALFETGRVDADTFARMEVRFGKVAALDLTAVCGYYATLGLALNIEQLPLPSGAVAPFAVLQD
ncbi:carboxymuconolactone decarboxylase family protein [Rhizobium lusitanum]|uniref:carboxymuconolactone decarboxylase family protein n=1 Tax=Rhizobium lusitanum TaxID=293958 RepID=UPI001574AD83|nr:carboxymuconolactone decarboxylase family protein [Rhizobium lusitanum]NTJ11589.1 carboxymuconolactone decarboxylase family protein [Rhizobium lusitanum]